MAPAEGLPASPVQPRPPEAPLLRRKTQPSESVSKGKARKRAAPLLQGTLEARGKVLVKLNVEEANLDKVLAVLPAMRAPTISELSGGGAFALEAVVAKSDINILIPALRDQGASDILEIPLSKIVH